MKVRIFLAQPFLRLSLTKVFISTKLMKKLKAHALSVDPNECIGFFEINTKNELRITDITTCKNISKEPALSGHISPHYTNKIKKLFRRNEKLGIIYGMYHSHPLSGKTTLSAKDGFIGKIYKRFRNQIIMGINGKSKRTVSIAFWRYERPNWIKIDMIIKGEDK